MTRLLRVLVCRLRGHRWGAYWRTEHATIRRYLRVCRRCSRVEYCACATKHYGKHICRPREEGVHVPPMGGIAQLFERG